MIRHPANGCLRPGGGGETFRDPTSRMGQRGVVREGGEEVSA